MSRFDAHNSQTCVYKRHVWSHFYRIQEENTDATYISRAVIVIRTIVVRMTRKQHWTKSKTPHGPEQLHVPTVVNRVVTAKNTNTNHYDYFWTSTQFCLGIPSLLASRVGTFVVRTPIVIVAVVRRMVRSHAAVLERIVVAYLTKTDNTTSICQSQITFTENIFKSRRANNKRTWCP